MPRNSQVVRRYAKALLNTLDSNSLHKAEAELSVMAQVATSNSTVKKFLVCPVISAEEKIGVFKELTTQFPTISNFLISVIRQDRGEYLADIAAEFSRLIEERAGEMTVDLEVASPAVAADEENIRNFLQEKWKRQIKFKTKINQDLIGGFLARGTGKVFDASVRNQLDSLKASLVS